MVNRLVLVLGDQLSEGLSALRHADKDSDMIVMAEVMDEGTYVPHHPKKIALVLSAMRHFADHLRGQGWQVAYTKRGIPLGRGRVDEAGAGARHHRGDRHHPRRMAPD